MFPYVHFDEADAKIELLKKKSFGRVLFHETVNKTTTLTLTIIVVMNRETCSFNKVPLFDVLHLIFVLPLNRQ